MKILAFAGRRKSGKTYAAEQFIEVASLYGHPFRRTSFAHELRKQFANLKGISPSLLTENFAKEEYREELVAFATEIKRTDPKFFIRSLFENILDYESVVIDDLRYIEELEEIWNRDGVIFKVEAEKKILEARGWKFTPGVDDELGETELGSLDPHTFIPYGGYFYNNSSTEALKLELHKIYTKHFIE